MELDLFAACLPGLEPLLADELRDLGAVPTAEAGGVAFAGDRDALLAAHLHLGTASHLLLRCGSFRALHLNELQTRTAQLPWRQWLRADVPFTVRATAKKSRLFHTGAIEERVTRGIAMALGIAAPTAPAPAAAATASTSAPATEAPTPTIAVRLVADQATLSLDTSATPLHRRGYRLATAKAPLREDLAHALLRAAGYDRGTALLDPFCGAGTIAIEAAAIAAGLPPGRLRPPPLHDTALADDAAWRRLVTACTANVTATAPPARIAASDRDAGAIAATADNAERAGVASLLDLHTCAFTAAPWLEHPDQAPRPVLVATNPPFGHRVAAERDLTNLWQMLGHRVRRLGQGARVALLAHDARLARRTGVALRQSFATRHGGLHVAALLAAAESRESGTGDQR